MNFVDQISSEYEGEYNFEEEIYEFDDLESPFTQEEELELAYELLDISSDEELEYFLGKLFKRAWRGLKKIGSKVGRVLRPLGGVLKGVAKRLLPMAAGAVGTYFGGPAGGAIASRLGSMASSALEMELEGAPEEQKELEIAKRFVRVAGSAARHAVKAPSAIDGSVAAQKAVISALRRHVPGISGLTKYTGATLTPFAAGKGGRWIRRGNKIVLTGL